MKRAQLEGLAATGQLFRRWYKCSGTPCWLTQGLTTSTCRFVNKPAGYTEKGEKQRQVLTGFNPNHHDSPQKLWFEGCEDKNLVY